MDYLILTSRGKFGAETPECAMILAFTLSSFDQEAVQVFHKAEPFAAYYQQTECVRAVDGWHWERLVAGQNMVRDFPLLHT